MADQSIAEIAKRLAEPFSMNDVEWRVGSTDNKDNPTKGIALAYITNRAIMKRLDDVMGIENWRNEFQIWRENGVLCGLSLRIGEEWITKWDGSDESDMEAIKGGFSDAMKRAAYQWGIGRYLYDLPTIWVRVEKRGRSTYLKETPSLPAWALPESERGNGPQQGSTQTTTPQDEDAGSQPRQQSQASGTGQTQQRAAAQNRTVTDKQIARLMAIASKNGWTSDSVSRVVKQIKKYESLSQIKAGEEYDKIVAWFEANKNPATEPSAQ